MTTSSSPMAPGHEMDAHLACQDIALWGSRLADSGAGFTIEGWAPSGSQEIAYSGSWSYTQSDAHVIAVISISELLTQAEAEGDASPAQGFHPGSRYASTSRCSNPQL